MYVEIRVSECDKLLYKNYTFVIEQVTRPGTPARGPLADRKPCIFLCNFFKADFSSLFEVKCYVLSTHLFYKRARSFAPTLLPAGYLPDPNRQHPVSLSSKILTEAVAETLFQECKHRHAVK